MAETQKQVSDYFSTLQLNEIKAVISKVEKQTSGEIRVEIVMHCDHDLRGKVYEQAVRDFEKEGMQNTRDKTGVLILVVLSEKLFVIIGDSGIYSKLSRRYWDNMARSMSLYFMDDNFYIGVCAVVESIGKQLAKYFPKKGDDTNELSDDIIVRSGN